MRITYLVLIHMEENNMEATWKVNIIEASLELNIMEVRSSGVFGVDIIIIQMGLCRATNSMIPPIMNYLLIL